MRIKIHFRKNLKMSPEKLASQCGHVAKEIGRMMASNARADKIIVLGVSDSKYRKLCEEFQREGILWYEQVDSGLTEVIAGTSTAFGYVEEM